MVGWNGGAGRVDSRDGGRSQAATVAKEASGMDAGALGAVAD